MTVELLDRVEDVLTLSPSQSGMLFDVVRGDAAPGSYIGVVSVSLDGQLDFERLKGAISAAVSCRDALRASFVWHGVSAPLQLVHRNIDVPCGFQDLSHLGEQKFDQAVAEYLLAERRAGFDIGNPPLVRATVMRAAETRHDLIFTIHHLVCDGWSAGIIIDDILARYHADGPVAKGLADGEVQFRDYLVWRKAKDSLADENFWRAYLPAPEGWADSPSAIATTAEGDASGLHQIESAEIDPDLEQSARDLARMLRITLPTFLAAVWAILLRRFGAGDTVVFGVANAGRPAAIPGLDRAVGAFVNTLPMRISVYPQQTAADFLIQTGANANARRAHEYAALADVKRWAGIAGGVEPYQTVFAYEGFPDIRAAKGQLAISKLHSLAPSRDALAISIVPGAPSRVDLYFDPSLHGADVVARMAKDYLALMAAIIADPQQRIGALAADFGLTPGQPAAPANWPQAPVHQQIWDWAAKAPDAPAIRCGADRLSYGELVRMADELAAKLAAQGVGAGDVVPILLPRGVASVAAMLAVMRTGAAYLPIDLSYPADRLRSMFEDCKPKALVLSKDDASAAPETTATLVFIDGDAPLAAFKPVNVAPDDAAYVIFTSGSQGRPKGVAVSHANLAYSTGIRNHIYGEPPSAFLVLSSLAFDSSVVGLYWTLTSGGEVVLSTPRLEQDMSGLGQLIQSAKVSHLLCLPSLCKTMLDLIPADRLASLETVIVAGEALTASIVKDQRRTLGHCRLFNEYGPTEATVWASVYDTADYTRGDMPIGRALPGASIIIADPDGHPLPDGATGEIMIGGPGVALGYLNNVAATAAAFLPDPANLGAKLYRTGDLGRRLQDGNILFFGRRDGQIKIRGHRIEHAEVEAALGAVMTFSECAVVAVPNPTGNRLIAYVSGQADGFDSKVARHKLSKLLAPFMVPYAIIALPELPHLPNGKIDRLGLAKNPPVAPDAEITACDPPQSFVEACLADIWAKVLGQDTVPRNADFFALGGDSLKSISAVFEAEAAGLNIAPFDMFDHPVLSDLAAHLERKAAEPVAGPGDDLMVHLNPEGHQPLFLMIHGSPQMCSHLAQAIGSDRPVAFQFSAFLRGEIDATQSIEAMAQDMLARLRSLRPKGPYYIGGYSIGGVIAIELARLLQSAGEDVPVLFLLDPSWETGLPATDAGPIGPSRRKSAARHALTLGRLAANRIRRRFGLGDAERLRISSVANTYRATLQTYRPKPYVGPVFIMVSTEVARILPSSYALNHCLTNQTVVPMEFNHLDLQGNTNALFTWTARLAKLLRDVETE
jgi:amino acid adenylation domain-containing protein